jgi:hypothetical protein
MAATSCNTEGPLCEQSLIVKALVRAGRWRGEVCVFARQVPLYEGPELGSQAEALADAIAWVNVQPVED